jgi:protein-L-isoaspartate(D-aspartate) O-methyltransferase
MVNHSEPQADAAATGRSNTIQHYIDAYVTKLKQAGVIHSRAVEQAFRTVPRHRLVRTFYISDQDDNYTKFEHDPDNPEPTHLEVIYSGAPLVTRFKDGFPASSSSDSRLVAHMLELLRLDRGMNVLEIGAGTGYNAALMAEIVENQSHVTTVDNQPDVVAQTQELLAGAGYSAIRVRCADGFYGFDETVPYDRVVVTVGSPDLSPHWVEHLKPDGFVLLPLRHAAANPLVRVSQRDDAIMGQVVGMSGFMPMRGKLWDSAYYGDSIQAADQSTMQIPVWADLHMARGTKVVEEPPGWFLVLPWHQRPTHTVHTLVGRLWPDRPTDQQFRHPRWQAYHARR